MKKILICIFVLLVAFPLQAENYEGRYKGTIYLQLTSPDTCPANVPNTVYGFRVRQSGDSITVRYAGTTYRLKGSVKSYGFKAKGYRTWYSYRDTKDVVTIRKFVAPTDSKNGKASLHLDIYWSFYGTVCRYLYSGKVKVRPL